MKNAGKVPAKSELYRQLPSVDDLLRTADLAPLIGTQGKVAVADAARTVLARFRSQISSGYLTAEAIGPALSGIGTAVSDETQKSLDYSLRPVINATGVILHTNLGRAPLAAAAFDHIRETAGRYSNLEFDLQAGERGKRDSHVNRLLRKLLNHDGNDQAASGEHDVATIVVNNNAAAVLLALNTLAEGGEVIVSRGELIEIGGSFRIPDVMSKSGAILREVGTTNRTHLADYERAITDRTRLLLRVHRSNFEITGFTTLPEIDGLVALARTKNLPLLLDLGSGALCDLRAAGMGGELPVANYLRAAVDVVTYSGDKLLGGPQAGLLSGRAEPIARMRANPLFRALRVDKLTYAALEATLLAYVKQDYDAIPILRMMKVSKEEIGARAEAVANKLRSAGIAVELQDGESVIGGGAAPDAALPSSVLALGPGGFNSGELAARLRAADPPVIARVEEDRVVLDLRTVFPEQDTVLADALIRAASPAQSKAVLRTATGSKTQSHKAAIEAAIKS